MVEKVWSVEKFRRRLAEDVKQICGEWGTNPDTELHRGVAFQRWVKDRILQHDGLERDQFSSVFTTMI
jgi:hypothetical protein